METKWEQANRYKCRNNTPNEESSTQTSSRNWALSPLSTFTSMNLEKIEKILHMDFHGKLQLPLLTIKESLPFSLTLIFTLNNEIHNELHSKRNLHNHFPSKARFLATMFSMASPPFSLWKETISPSSPNDLFFLSPHPSNKNITCGR